MVSHYPFPSQKPEISLDKIIMPTCRRLTQDEEVFHHARILSKEVQLLKAQYLLIESDLIETFNYVYPTPTHLQVYSPKFALIIKNACNLFEVICRKIYNDIYGIHQKINIYHFLSLDIFLDFKKNDNIECLQLESEFPKESSNILTPFNDFLWDRKSPIRSQMIPTWWVAYNNIKHNFADYTNYANLNNALRSVFALACLIYKVYGPGVVIGKAQWYEIIHGEKCYYQIDTALSQLFYSTNGRLLLQLEE